MRQFRQVFLLIFTSLASYCCSGQTMTYTDFSPWQTDSLQDTLDWVGNTETNQVSVCILEGNNHRSGHPALRTVFNYSYVESWFETWWDDAGVVSTTSLTPQSLSVWSSGVDTIIFCFSKVVEGDSNFLYFHQVDFTTTQVTIEASLCGVPINHNLVDFNQSSAFPSFVTTASQATFSMSAGANRRHLVRFNQDFDYVRVIESNPADLLTLGFMGYGNFKGNACPSTCPCESNPLLDIASLPFNAELIADEVVLQWQGNEDARWYQVEKMNPSEGWEGMEVLEGNKNANFSFRDPSPWQGENTYRIRWMDRQTRLHVSATQTVNYLADMRLKVFPNPLIGDRLFVQLNQALDEESMPAMLMFDQQGKTSKLIYEKKNQFTLSIHAQMLSRGLYFLWIEFEDGTRLMRKVYVK